jgi:hypothetical protein
MMAYLYDTSFTGLNPGVQNDNRTALQAAINSATSQGKGLYITQPYGLSVPSSGAVLNIPSNAQIKFVGNGYLKLLAHNTDSYQMMLLDGVSNVWIENPRLDGSMEMNSFSGGEYGMGISLYNTNNVQIMRPNIIDTWGDGIYIGAGNSNTVLWSPYAQGVRRNGISVISANGLDIYNPVTENIKATNPKCGIDFEPNDNSNVLQNIRVFSPVTIGCYLGLEFSIQGLVGPIAKNVSISVYDWKDIHSQDTALNRYDLNKGSYSVSGFINIHNVTYVKSNILKDIAAPYDNSVVWSLTNEVSIT